jgi:hypothetical protein
MARAALIPNAAIARVIRRRAHRPGRGMSNHAAIEPSGSTGLRASNVLSRTLEAARRRPGFARKIVL